MFVVNLKELPKKDFAAAGGKAASLAKLMQAGFPIPEGFVILPCALDESLKKEILKEFLKMKLKNAAIRSSATLEDSAKASWAGELETYLNTSRKDLIFSIENCRASIFSKRAAAYRKEKGLGHKKVSVAVIVQKMVESETSGICFTVNPINKNPKQMVIEAGYGLGEAIVGGKITPDNYIVQKSSGKVIEKNISAQKMMIIQKMKGGTKEINVPKDKQNKQKLPDKKIVELARICAKIEKFYPSTSSGQAYAPQDIEWAFSKNKLYILQSRPITTL